MIGRNYNNAALSESGSSRYYANNRLVRYFIFLIFCTGAVILRLWYIQIYEGQKYSTEAESNRLKIHRDNPLRGMISDRNGMILINNKASYTLILNREDLSAKLVEEVLQRICGLLLSDQFTIESAHQTVNATPRSWPVRLKNNLTYPQLARIEAHKFELPGVSIEITPNRSYHYGTLASQVLGYIGEISDKELERLSDRGYAPGDIVGKSGIEQSMNEYLQGKKGYKVVEVNAYGRVVRTLDEPPPVPPIGGAQVTLTIDIDLQRTVEDFLMDYKGVILVLQARTGEILAMASHPTYDPNIFMGGISVADWLRLSKDPAEPLMNRAIQSTFPPGSTVKPLMALTGLESGTIKENTTFNCSGAYDFYGHVFRCWKKGGHGTVYPVKAIEQSCNVFFYNVGALTNIEIISRYAHMFGLGSLTHIDLSSEVMGLFPDPAWKMKKFKQKWFQGETLSVVIGQGGVVVTPLQLVTMMNAIATGGLKVKPHLIKQVAPSGDIALPELPDFTPDRIEISARTLKIVRDGIFAVVNGAGTATRARVEGLNIAGKTGTAQTVAMNITKGISDKELPPKYRDHSWFVSVAPLQDPEIAVVVFLENGGKLGAIEKLEIAKRIYLYYFKRELVPMHHFEFPAKRG